VWYDNVVRLIEDGPKKQEKYHVIDILHHIFLLLKMLEVPKKINANHSKENSHQKDNDNINTNKKQINIRNNKKSPTEFGSLIFHWYSNIIIEKKEDNIKKEKNNEFILFTLANDINIDDQYHHKKIEKDFKF